MRIPFALLVVGALSTLTVAAQDKEVKRKKNFSNIALNINSTQKEKIAGVTHKSTTTHFSIGIRGKFQNFQGVGVNLLGNVLERKGGGVLIGGIANMQHQFAGIGVAGITNVYHKAGGIQIGGLVNVGNTFHYGVQVSSLVNINEQLDYALSLSALMNIADGSRGSVMLSALGNVAKEQRGGLMLSALGNISASNSGLQIAGLTNVSAENRGFMLALTNVSETNNAVQLGVFNATQNSTKGVQIGIVNLSKDNGAKQFGLVNIQPNTKYELYLTGGNRNIFNAAVRFKNRSTYTQLGMGTYHLGTSHNFTWSGHFKAGLYKTIAPNWEVTGDIGWEHIEMCKNKDDGYPRRAYAIQPRVGVVYTPFKHIGFTANGGYEWTKEYSGTRYRDHSLTFEVGIVIK